MAHVRFSAMHRFLALLLCLVLLLTTTLGGTLAYVIVRTPSLLNTFLSGVPLTGDLVLSKTVTHPFGSGYVIPDGLTFDFTVALGPEFAGATVSGTHGDLTADANGDIAVSLRPDGVLRIRDLPRGTAVTVTEHPAPGFAADGGAVRTLTIGRGDNHAAFNNVYTPAPAALSALSVTGAKVLSGRDWQPGDTFSFLLEYKAPGAQEWQSVGNAAVTYATEPVLDPETGEPVLDETTGEPLTQPVPGFDTFDLTEAVRALAYPVAGEYAFRLTEQPGSIGGVGYDSTVSYFDVLVDDPDMDGSLQLCGVTGSPTAAVTYDAVTGAYAVQVTVTNTYAPAGSARAALHISKTVQSLSSEEKSLAGYTFELYDAAGVLAATSAPTTAAGETTIGLIFAAADAGRTFRYTLRETNAGQTLNGMTYDAAAYDITAAVVDNLDGTVSAYLYPTDAAVAVDEADDSAAESAADSEGAAADEESAATESDAASGEGAGDASSADSAAAESNAVESEAAESGAASEAAESAGEMPAEADASAVESEAVSAPAESESAALAAETNFDEAALDEATSDEMASGAPILQDDISAADDTVLENSSVAGDSSQNAPVEDAAVESTVGESTSLQNAAANVSSVNDEGTAAAGVPVGATIPDGADNTLRCSFVNVYDPADAYAAFGGAKQLTGRAINDGEFTFDLYATGEGFVVAPEAVPVQTTVNAGESFAFATIGFENVGVYRYVIAEDSSAALGGITYDDAVYYVTVTVSDVNGVLQATVRTTDAAGNAADVVFRNSYAPRKATVVLSGTKSLTGGELAAGMFGFLLYPADAAYRVQGDVLARTRNTADGRFVFAGVDHTAPGEYYYVIAEDIYEQKQGVTYDTTAYGVKVSVRDDGLGSLLADVTLCVIGGTPVETIHFANTYTPPVVPPVEPEEPENPEGPVTPEQPEKTDPTDTGDHTPVSAYIALMAVSVAMMMVLFTEKRQRRRRG